MPTRASRLQAGWALGAIDDVSPSTGSSVRFADADGRKSASQAAWALGAIDIPSAVPGAIASLKPSSRGPRQAAWALGAIGHSRASDGLLERAQGQGRRSPTPGRMGPGHRSAGTLRRAEGGESTLLQDLSSLRACWLARRASPSSRSPRSRSASAPTPRSSASSTRVLLSPCPTATPTGSWVVWEHNCRASRKQRRRAGELHPLARD